MQILPSNTGSCWRTVLIKSVTFKLIILSPLICHIAYCRTFLFVGSKVIARTHTPLESQGSLDSSRISPSLIFGSISMRQSFSPIPSAHRSRGNLLWDCVCRNYKNPDLRRTFLSISLTPRNTSTLPHKLPSCRQTLVGNLRTLASRVLTTAA